MHVIDLTDVEFDRILRNGKANILKLVEILVLKSPSAPWSLKIFSLATSCQRFLLPCIWLWLFSPSLLFRVSLSPYHISCFYPMESGLVITTFHLWPRISRSSLQGLTKFHSKQIPFFFFLFFLSTSQQVLVEYFPCTRHIGINLSFYLGCSSVQLQLSLVSPSYL